MLIALFAVATFSMAHDTAVTPDSVEALVRRAQASVESGRDAELRRTLDAIRALRPSDPSAVLALATLDRLTYRDTAAERGYRVITMRAGDSDAVAAYAVLGLGMLRVQEARLADAEPLLRRAVAAFARWNTAAARARATALAMLATVVSRTVGLDSSLALFDAALREVPRGDAWLRSLVVCNGLVVRVRKADPRAAALARPAAQAARRASNPRAASACLAALAQDYERRTLIDSALATFGEVADLQRASRNLSGLAVTRQWQGYVYYSLKTDLVSAEAALTEALALGKRTGTLAAAAWASLGMAEVALMVGDLPASGAYARTASALFTSTGDEWGMLQARSHEGDVALLNRALPAARAADEAVIRAAAAVWPTEAVHARGRLAWAALLDGDPVGAERELDTAYRLSRTLNMPEWRQEDTYGRAIVALERGRFDDAARRLHALAAFLPADEYAERSDVLTRLAEVSARRGDLPRAQAQLGRAEDLLDRWRGSLSQQDLQASAVQTKKLDWDPDLGFATIVSQLALGGRAPAAFELTERRRARVLLERVLRRQALASNPKSISLETTALSERAVRAVIPNSTAVLSLLTGRGGEPTTVFVLTRDRLSTVAADPVDDHLLEIQRFAGLVAAGEDPEDLSQRLGDAFLRNALALLPANVRDLVIVPDGPLHRIPFDVLRGGDGGLLADRFAISLAPSASVAAAWWGLAPRRPLPRLVAFGDPAGVRITDVNRDSVPPRLPAAAEEVRSIARFASQADVFVGPNATEAALRHERLDDVGIVHFATHAQVDEWSLLGSSLLLAPGSGEDGRVTVHELTGLHINANLVVLSACSSGSGAVLTGEGLQGLTAPLLEAGASSVVATLWQIGDRSAAPLIESFYAALASGATVGDALHRAKLSARARGVSPAVWAAFTLTGDARVRTALREPRAIAGARVPTAAAVAALVLLAAGYLASRTSRRRKSEAR